MYKAKENSVFQWLKFGKKAQNDRAAEAGRHLCNHLIWHPAKSRISLVQVTQGFICLRFEHLQRQYPQVPTEHCKHPCVFFSVFLWWLSLDILHHLKQIQSSSIQCTDSSVVPFTNSSSSPFSHHSPWYSPSKFHCLSLAFCITNK